MDRLPKYMDLCEYLICRLRKLDNQFDDPGLMTFCELNHIENLAVEGSVGKYADDRDDLERFLTVGVKFSSTVKELKPLEGNNLLWLERHYGAVLKMHRMNPYSGGGGYVYYRMYLPNRERMDELYPEWDDVYWTGSEWEQ